MKKLTRELLLEIAKSLRTAEVCSECAPLLCEGWESAPSSFDLKKLKILGTLRNEDAEECWDEFHPDGTNIWSKNAPISIKHHPYNRSDVCECKGCKKKFLRYTEYGGYYVDERIRELNPNLIV